MLPIGPPAILAIRRWRSSEPHPDGAEEAERARVASSGNEHVPGITTQEVGFPKRDQQRDGGREVEFHATGAVCGYQRRFDIGLGRRCTNPQVRAKNDGSRRDLEASFGAPIHDAVLRRRCLDIRRGSERALRAEVPDYCEAEVEGASEGIPRGGPKTSSASRLARSSPTSAAVNASHFSRRPKGAPTKRSPPTSGPPSRLRARCGAGRPRRRRTS